MDTAPSRTNAVSVFSANQISQRRANAAFLGPRLETTLSVLHNLSYQLSTDLYICVCFQYTGDKCA